MTGILICEGLTFPGRVGRAAESVFLNIKMIQGLSQGPGGKEDGWVINWWVKVAGKNHSFCALLK